MWLRYASTLGVVGQRRWQDFQRNLAVEVDVLGQIDFPHPTRADLLQNLVVGDCLTDQVTGDLRAASCNTDLIHRSNPGSTIGGCVEARRRGGFSSTAGSTSAFHRPLGPGAPPGTDFDAGQVDRTRPFGHAAVKECRRRMSSAKTRAKRCTVDEDWSPQRPVLLI
jgi:hypothetical protein